MDHNNTVVATFKSHVEAEDALKELHSVHFEMRNVSIVASDYRTDEHVVGFYNTGERMSYWGGMGAAWGGLWGLLFGTGLFLIPGVGPVLVGGTLVASIVAALEGAALGGGVSALGAGLYGLGIPKDSILEYETAIRAGKFLVVVRGTDQESKKAREILQHKGSLSAVYHQFAQR